MRITHISNKPESKNYFDIARKAEILSQRLRNENEIRAHWLNEEFEKIEERIHDLSDYLEHGETSSNSLNLSKKNLQKITRDLRLADSRFVEIDYLDESNKKIVLGDIENQVKDIKKQLKFLEKNYFVH